MINNTEDKMSDKEETWLRVLSSIILGITAVGLLATIFNIYSYLYKLRINKLLITAFYVTLVVMLIADVIQWSCQLANPRFYAILFFIEKDADYGDKVKLYQTFRIACCIATIFNYAFNWVVVATIRDLSQSIKVVAGDSTTENYRKQSRMNFILIIVFTLMYIGCFIAMG